jgi:geranylgeranyl diphosphate synthase type II
VASLELGGVVAGASREQLSALAGYGEKVGLAFQITDDLLDVAGEQQDVGKRLGKDADRGKLTYPRLLGVEASRQQGTHLIAEACGMIEIFGANATPLKDLAKFVCTRKN